MRSRPYPIHAPKALAMPLLDEVARVWPAELASTATHAFRGAGPDAYLPFLAAHFVVERWREALLWAWVVGRVGGAADEWGAREQRAAWRALGGGAAERTLSVRLARRKTLDRERVDAALHAAGERVSGRTAYTFCESPPPRLPPGTADGACGAASEDGYPYVDGARGWPRFPPAGAPAEPVLCTISFDECIAAAASASAAFMTVAFGRPQCGDCSAPSLPFPSPPPPLPPSARAPLTARLQSCTRSARRAASWGSRLSSPRAHARSARRRSGTWRGRACRTCRSCGTGRRGTTRCRACWRRTAA